MTRSKAFTDALPRWIELGSLKDAAPFAEIDGARGYVEIFRTKIGPDMWDRVADFLADNGGEFDPESGFTRAEEAEIQIRDRANYYAHAFNAGDLIIFAEP